MKNERGKKNIEKDTFMTVVDPKKNTYIAKKNTSEYLQNPDAN